MILPFPQWLLEMPDNGKKARAAEAFFIQLGCLYASRSGGMRVLADTIGVNYSTLRSQVSDRRIIYVSEKTLEGVARVMRIQDVEWTDQGLMFQTEFRGIG